MASLLLGASLLPTLGPLISGTVGNVLGGVGGLLGMPTAPAGGQLPAQPGQPQPGYPPAPVQQDNSLLLLAGGALALVLLLRR